MSKLLKLKSSKIVLGLMVVAMVFALTPTMAQAALSSGQVDAIITLLNQFGADATTVANVRASLTGGTPVVTTPGTSLDFGTATLRVGSKGVYVQNLQTLVGATADGSFGPLTKAAVMAWQSANGLVADGVFGPASRAAAGGSTTTTTPTTPVATGPVSVTISSDNPASSTLVAGQATADLAHFAFSGSGTVTGVTFQRLGVSADTTPSNVYLFDGATRLTDAASVASDGVLTFNVPSGIFTVNGSLSVSLKSDIAASTSGQTLGFQLTSFTTSDGTVSTSLSGNLHDIASATLAGVSAGTVTPSGATINPAPNVTVWQSSLTVSQRDVLMKRLSLRNIGSAPATAFANFKLYVNGVEVATATGLDANGYVTFDLTSAPVTLVSGTRVVRVDADVISGASRTIQFSLRNAADVDFVDSSFGVNISPTSAPWGSASINTISGSSGGTLTVDKDISSPSTNVTLAGSNISLGVFKFTAFGEPIKVETLTAGFTFTDGGTANAAATLRNGRILLSTDNGANWTQYGSTTTLAAAGTSFTLNYTINPGTPVLVQVKSDIFDNDGTGSLDTSDTLLATLVLGSSNGQRVDSLGSLNVPSASVSANTLSIASASATLTKNATYANQNTDLPATAFKVGSWNLDGSSVEDILLTTFSFDVDAVTNATFTASDLTSMYMVMKDSAGNEIYRASPLATVAAADNNFSVGYTLKENTSISIELYSNFGVAANVTTSDSFKTDLTVTGTAIISGTAVTATSADTDGQTITYAASSITATKDASSPIASIVHDNQTVSAAAFKFAAVTASYKITDLTFTLANATVASAVELYDDGVLVGSKSGAATVTFSGLDKGVNPFNVGSDTDNVLEVRLVLNNVGVGGGTSGSSQLVTLTGFTAVNTSTGVSAAGTESNPEGNAMYAYASVPSITRKALPTTVLQAGTQVLAKFDVVSNGGTVAWKQVMFDITKIAAPTIASVELWDVTGGGNTQVTAAEVFQNGTGGVASTCVADNTVCELLITVGTDADDNVEEEVSGTKTYEVRATIAGSLAAANSITTSIKSNLGYEASAAFTTNENDNTVDDQTFVWSDQSAASHDTGTADWVGESTVLGLPTATWTMTFPSS